MAWSVSKLSESQTERSSFELEFTNVPDTLILDKDYQKTISTRIRGSGFQFLGLQFGKRKMAINLVEVRQSNQRYYLPRHLFLAQIEGQLPGSMDLLEVEGDTLFVDFLDMHSKKVPVVGNINVELGQNYLLEGGIRLKPDSITAYGPQSELNSIKRIVTNRALLKNIKEDFEVKVAVKKPETIEYTRFSDSIVKLSGTVFRFTEQILDVPVEVINLPPGTEIKTFPSTIRVLCKARIDQLKDLEPQDITLIADYQTFDDSTSYLVVRLEKKPDWVHAAQLLEERVEFILKRN
jgi:hypothetical protein